MMTTYIGTDDVQIYIFDFGSEALKIFKDAPHIGDVVLSTDTEKINRLFEILQREMKKKEEQKFYQTMMVIIIIYINNNPN